MGVPKGGSGHPHPNGDRYREGALWGSLRVPTPHTPNAPHPPSPRDPLPSSLACPGAGGQNPADGRGYRRRRSGRCFTSAHTEPGTASRACQEPEEPPHPPFFHVPSFTPLP